MTLALLPTSASKVSSRLPELSPAVFQAVLEIWVLSCCRRCSLPQAGRVGIEQGQGLSDTSVSEMLKINGSDPGGGGGIANVDEEPQALRDKHHSGPQCR